MLDVSVVSFSYFSQDMNNFYKQYKSIEPWLKQKTPPADPTKENLQSIADRDKLVRSHVDFSK